MKKRLGIVPAAGKGMRFKELGKQYPKSILPYKEVPIIVHNIRWLFDHECEEVVIVVNHQKEKIMQVVHNYFRDDHRITFAIQGEQNGLSGAIYEALMEIGEHEFKDVLVVLGDIFPDGRIEEFPKSFVSVQTVDDFSRWCMVKTDENGFVEDLFDKPDNDPRTREALSGIYYFNDIMRLKTLLSEQLSNEHTKISGEFQLSWALDDFREGSGLITCEIDIIDFGTLTEYLENRNIKESRSFNDIIVENGFITKSSSENPEKLIAEVNWFTNVPDEIKAYTPRIFSHGFFDESVHYKMERLYAPSLRELYLFIDSSVELWDSIFDKTFEFIDKEMEFGRKNNFMERLYEKTVYRVSDIQIPVENKVITDFLKRFKEILDNSRSAIEGRYSLMHGDLCFSNMMFDIQHENLKVIDPRGELFGSELYEVAKLYHSVICDYDFIDAELYYKTGDEVVLYNDGKQEIKDLFMEKLKERYSARDLRLIEYITASLFLSMIPLHGHNEVNQKLFYKTFKTIDEGLKHVF